LGRPETAARLISSFETLSEDIGGSWPWVTRMRDETLAIIQSKLDPAEFEIAWQEGSRLTADKAVAVALDALETLD
jgi:hypothetical protein